MERQDEKYTVYLGKFLIDSDSVLSLTSEEEEEEDVL